MAVATFSSTEINSENLRVIPVKKCKHKRNDNIKMNFKKLGVKGFIVFGIAFSVGFLCSPKLVLDFGMLNSH